MNRIALPALALLLSSCAVGPDYQLPSLGEITGWSRAESAASVIVPAKNIESEWWKTFNDPTLTVLITDAAMHNHDIRIALASIDEARAQRRGTRADFYPTVGANLEAQRTKNSSRDGARSDDARNRFDASLDASWEPDIFGGVRRSVEAADARVEASTADYHDVMLSVFAEVARSYFELRGAQKRIAVTQQNIEVLRQVEQLAQNRYDAGAVSAFDVAQARGERETNEAMLPNLEAEMTAGIYRLSVLTGKPPEAQLAALKATAPLPMPPDAVPVGLKSDILLRRPDVKRAERALAAATADISGATAELFPRFPLTGSVGTTALTFGELFASGGFTYFVAQAITAPLFQGGRLRAAIDAADARQRQMLAAYEQTVIAALEDAESSLVRYGKEWETLKGLLNAEASRMEAARIAHLRYESGNEDFLVVLDAERSLIATQDAIIQSETRILTKLTQLYKALGGGWETMGAVAPVAPPPAAP